jgi:hypothetical protein
LRLANIQALALAHRDSETDTSVGTRRRSQALDLTLLQALGLANIQTLGLAQRDAETDTSVGTRLRRWALELTLLLNSFFIIECQKQEET